MKIGIVGLGRMGGNMARRLMRAGHQCVGYASRRETVQRLVAEGAEGAASLAELVERLPPPRAVWLMVPAATVGSVLEVLMPLLGAGDVVIDGGNSYYQDDIARSAAAASRGIHYLDVGTSGGVWGLERGYCLMIGGPDEPVRRLEPLFKALAPGIAAAARTDPSGPMRPSEQGYLHCGPSGAGHFVKMIHNGIEYGLMAAYAEGMNILRRANIGSGARGGDAETTPLRDPEHYRYEIDVAEVAELWRRGSVVGSWLLDLTARALRRDPGLAQFSGDVSDSGEGRWTLLAAINEGVPAPVIGAALFGRFSSQGNSTFADRLLSAMRFEFGGHVEKPKDGG
ncbi:MAG: phosphogluconate dehydrogenase (NAD(+)-dependent, decarboxylating) [Acidiferrobacteraceae bacterium]